MNLEDKKTLWSPDGEHHISFFKDYDDLGDLSELNRFVKNCEKLVRTSDEYSAYIDHLKTEKGLNFCQKHPNITDEMAPIEMHHGPLLTLFDYCKFVTVALLRRGVPVTSFRVSNLVIKEHLDKHVQTIMLCENCHKMGHGTPRDIMDSARMAFGDLQGFIDRWGDGIDEPTYHMLMNNINVAYNDSEDSGILQPNVPSSWDDEY